MSTIGTRSEDAQEQILNSVRRSQQAMTDVVAAWAKAVARAVPTVDALPESQPERFVDGAFDFVQQLLDAQRDFAHNVLAAAAPVLGKVEKKPGGKAAKAARKREAVAAV
jgi:hypothetical protein